MATVVKLNKAAFGELAAAKLESSGLTVEQGLALGMYDVGNAATLERYFDPLPALVIPYYDIDRKPLKAHSAWPDFYRARYLGEDHSFKAATDGKPRRYVQPAKSHCHAYFPKLIDWKAVAADPGEPISITEGELKAAKACAEGFFTIGLGGVWNFRAIESGAFFLPELERFNWCQRQVTIIYDSDYMGNANICASMNALSAELQERGAIVSVVDLPDVYSDDRKTGLDDFLMMRSDEELAALIHRAAPLGMTKALWNINQEIVFVEDPGFVVVRATGQKMDPAKFSAHSRWSTHNTIEPKISADGKIQYKKVAAAPVWLKWPLRKAVTKLTYAPGSEQFCDYKGLPCYNSWKGWGVQPLKGDITPWLELAKFIFSGLDKVAVEWFLDWCAYPLQYPGTKLLSACLIWGRKQGTGKTLIFYTLKRIYGENFIKIKNEDLKDTWWLENKQFVLGDEISGSDKRAEADAMKSMITQEEVNINVKYVPQFSVPDCANYGFTSNHPDALFLDEEDRRHFIHEVTAEEPLPSEFYKRYQDWMDGAGAGALFHWLLQRDLSRFNPKGEAPKTAARAKMVRAGRSDLALWCSELVENPATKLMFGEMRHQRDLFTSKELLEFYEREHERSAGRVTVNGMSRALHTAGFIQANGGDTILLADKKQGRYFIVRNRAKWEKVKNGRELAKHISLGPVRG